MEFWNEDLQDYRTRPLVLQITRNISASMTFLIELIREILLGGAKTVVVFTSWDWIDKNPCGRTARVTVDNRCSGCGNIMLQTKWQGSGYIRWFSHDVYFCIWSMETFDANTFFLYWWQHHFLLFLV